jgi:hypothetical protein
MSLHKISMVAVMLVASVLVAGADGWQRYANARFGYAIDIPPGFSEVAEADNSDGGTSRSADGSAEFAVWAAWLVDTGFSADVAERMRGNEADGWTLSYRRETASGASWSGLRDGRILYARAIPLCDGAAGYFRLEYPQTSAKVFDAVVKRLVKGFGGGGCK